MGAGMLGRAFVSAYQQALANGARGGAAGAAMRGGSKRLSPSEASDILGVKEKAGLPEVYAKYDKLFNANNPKTGGSLYLQAKIHSAKTLLEREAVERGATARSEEQQQPENKKEDEQSPRIG